jgi:hypothetical protein
VDVLSGLWFRVFWFWGRLGRSVYCCVFYLLVSLLCVLHIKHFSVLCLLAGGI